MNAAAVLLKRTCLRLWVLQINPTWVFVNRAYSRRQMLNEKQMYKRLLTQLRRKASLKKKLTSLAIVLFVEEAYCRKKRGGMGVLWVVVIIPHANIQSLIYSDDVNMIAQEINK